MRRRGGAGDRLMATIMFTDIVGSTELADPTQHFAMYIPLGWAKDALSPSSFFVGPFYSPAALADQGNGSLVGATAEQLEEWGNDVTDVPNADAQIEACVPLAGAAQFECWAGLYLHMMENVLPSMTYGSGVGAVLAARRAPSFDRIVVAPEDLAYQPAFSFSPRPSRRMVPMMNRTFCGRSASLRM